MADGPQRAVALGTTVASVLLLLAAPTPVECLRTLGAASSAADQAAPLLALLALLAWVLAAWLALTVLLTAGGHLPGQAGRALQSLARRIAPAAVRRGIEVALGLSVVLGTLATPAAAATHGSEALRASSTPRVDLDWAAPAPDPAAPDLDWSAVGDPVSPPPTTPLAPTPLAPTPRAAPGAAQVEVVVQPGDTLWDLAAQELRDRGASEPSAEPTTAEVAAAWPAWWAANREAVGDDPDLLRPGTALTRPSEGPPPSG